METLDPLPPVTSSASACPMAKPVTYSGEADACSGFLLQCSLYFEMQPHQFISDRAKIAFIISLLSGRALQWAESIWNSRSPVVRSLNTFVDHFREVFGTSTSAISVHDELFRLRQAGTPIHDYTVRFRTLAAASGWNETALLAAYRRGLDPQTRRQMAIYDDTVGLENFLQRALHISQHLTACHTEESFTTGASPATRPPAPEPMQMERYHLTPTERARRSNLGLCLYCGAHDHLLPDCSIRPTRPAVSTVQILPDVSKLPHIDALLIHMNQSFPAKVLVDSGASGNFISSLFLTEINVPRHRNATHYQITTIQGKPLGKGLVRSRTPEVTLRIGSLHSEYISFLVLEDATVDIVLGRPWLALHHPDIHWNSGEVLKWSDYCFKECLTNLPEPPQANTSAFVCSTSIESPIPQHTVQIPTEYQAFQDVFSKSAATRLPPHRPWDCAIDLLPEAKLPKGRIYPLSIPEHTAMEKYIQEALQQGFIRPSTSPAASSFFFVAKKDGGLRPCIDYRVLNAHTVKFAYPLPLVPTTLEDLRGASIFTKLDLRSAYNLVRIRRGDEWKTAFITPSGHYEYRVMPYGLSNSPSVFQNFMNEVFRDMLHRFVIVYIDDILIYSPNLDEHQQHVTQVLQRLRQHHLYLKLEKCEFHQSTVQFLGYVITPDGVQMDQGKVEAVRNWPQPTTVKELQRFLGFANFYRRFIAQYSQMSAPLTSLLRHKPKSLSWMPEATQAFQHLKFAFCSAPALLHPNPNLRFVVEVDASTLGVGAVLSQWKGEPPVLHPCAYFSKKLSPAEQNYDIGDRELLAIKLALEEWRHWLEGAQHPFEVITDHKNLQYLRDAKRLNPRQARWALFFTRFRFTVTYRPGHKNLKADALSRLHQPDPSPDCPEPILSPTVFVCPIEWALDDQIRAATLDEPAPLGGPEGKSFVPTALRLALLDSVHSSPGSGHPGNQRTLSLLRNKYWWPNMARDVARYIKGCSVCAIASTPRRLPEGKLVPLPIPHRPWSHLGIDFATDLPSSNGFTTILVVIDRFSKACKLIPLRGLPTALETAEALFQLVFRNFGIPEDIVSDRGPQFTSRVWHAFFRLLGVTVSLSSGYHPQSNGQTERKIQEIGRYLRAYCHEHQDTWSQYLPWAEYAQNSLRQETTGLTPFQCILGYQPPLFPWTGEPSEVPAVDYWFRESERVWDSAHIRLQQAVRRHKINADVRRTTAPMYRPGDQVWLSTRDIRLRRPCKKLSPRYIGPFPILRQINEVTYKLRLPNHYRISPTFHVSLLKPFTNPLLPPSTEPEIPPPPEVDTNETIYRVKDILDSRRRGGRLQYLVDWEGYGPEERSWVDRDDILDPSLITDFHQVHPDRPAPRGRGRPRRRSRAPGVARGGGGTVTDSPTTLSTHTRSQSPDY